MGNTSRMTSLQRREQLIQVGRALFAAKGFEAVSVEEIAANAKVSKPIVYEHFGGKEGLYAVIVDREMRALTDALTTTLSDPDMHPRQIVEKAALALLTYIEENAEGFQVLVRDSPSTDPAGSFNSLLGDISMRVEDLLTAAFKRQKLSTKGVPYYAQMLVGMTVFTGQYWADRPKVNKEQLAAYIVDLAWHGLSRLDSKPTLRFEGQKARQMAAKRAAREEKEAQRGEADKTTATEGTAESEDTAESEGITESENVTPPDSEAASAQSDEAQSDEAQSDESGDIASAE